METTNATRGTRRGKWIAGIFLILAGIGGLAAWAIAAPGALAYYKTPSEIATLEPAGQAKLLRVGGRVAQDSLRKDGSLVTFRLTDGRSEVPVVYRGDVPDTLKELTDAVAEGRLSTDGTLRASRVQAKCSSKFVPADSTSEHLGRT